MSMYTILKLTSGDYQCVCQIQDGIERWEETSREKAVRSLIVAAKNLNGAVIFEKDIYVPSDTPTKTKYRLDVGSLRAGDNIQEEWTLATKMALLDEVERLRAKSLSIQSRSDSFDLQETEQYGHGLIDGVAGRSLSGSGKGYSKEYLRGHGDGNAFFFEMMSKTRKRLNLPLTSQVMGNPNK